MDVPRPFSGKKRRRKRLIVLSIGISVIVLISAGLARLKPAAPVVPRQQVWLDVVKRGEMLRKVHGNGTLVPEEVVWITTMNAGRIAQIRTLPGAIVETESILIELSNPAVEKEAFDAEWQVKGAEAELANLRVQLEAQRLSQQALVATAQASYKNAKLDADANEELAKGGLIPALTQKLTRSKAEELLNLWEIEKERLKISGDAAKAQIAVQEAKVEQLRAQLQLKREQVSLLKIRAGIGGVLQRLGDTMPLQVGQQIPAGGNVARVANPAKLKAEIKINETQAKDIQHGQKAYIDTHNGIVQGHVTRIDPGVENGTVTVDITLDGQLPKGARPDLSVEGIIELDRLSDVLYVGKPAVLNANGPTRLFKLTSNGREAVKVTIRLGRSSANEIEVIEGLKIGEQIILSDMSQWEMQERVRIE